MTNKWSEVLFWIISASLHLHPAATPLDRSEQQIWWKNETHPGFRLRRGNLRDTKQQTTTEWLIVQGRKVQQQTLLWNKQLSCWLKRIPVPFLAVCKWRSHAALQSVTALRKTVKPAAFEMLPHYWCQELDLKEIKRKNWTFNTLLCWA